MLGSLFLEWPGHRLNKIILLTVLAFILGMASVSAQHDTTSTVKKMFGFLFKKKDHTFNYGSFIHADPIRDYPVVGYRSSLRKDEKIIVDVHPVLSLSIYDNFERRLKQRKLFSQGYYFSFRSHFRMYNEQSTPVKMPSYKVLLGLKHLFRINQQNYIGYSIESGHYSNGQSGCAFIGGGKDGSHQSDSVWATINNNSKLSDLINRTDGDFSTNLTELMLSYRYVTKLDTYAKPKHLHTLAVGAVYYHDRLFGLFDKGGYSNNAVDVYGRWRFLFNYIYNYNWRSGYRILFSENIELISGAHPSVDPFRSLTQATFFLPRSLGFYVNFIHGHDDYNLRFVDSGNQFGVGITWDFFPPLEVGIKAY
jgi:hypothetical protein